MIGRFLGMGERRNFRVSVFVDPVITEIEALAQRIVAEVAKKTGGVLRA